MLLLPETQKGGFTLRDLPIRRGGRPKVTRSPCELQCSDHGGTDWVGRLVEEASAWPHVEYAPSTAAGPESFSFCLSAKAMTADPAAFISPREFARLLGGGSTVYLAMRLVDAHWAIIRGWAEPHHAGRIGVMPAGVMVVYTPRDEGELAASVSLFRASYHFACTDPFGNQF